MINIAVWARASTGQMNSLPWMALGTRVDEVQQA